MVVFLKPTQVLIADTGTILGQTALKPQHIVGRTRTPGKYSCLLGIPSKLQKFSTHPAVHVLPASIPTTEVCHAS